MKHRMSLPSRREKGVVLIIALVMLLLVTMVSIATIRTTTMDERMAGNARDRDKALQAAEAAVRTCLQQLLVDTPSSYTGQILTPRATGSENWEVPANWAEGSTNSVQVSIPGEANTGSALASNPRCLVERIGTGDNYRVTGRATGGSDSTIVMIQATYSSEY